MFCIVEQGCADPLPPRGTRYIKRANFFVASGDKAQDCVLFKHAHPTTIDHSAGKTDVFGAGMKARHPVRRVYKL